jgi:hypothetical protein
MHVPRIAEAGTNRTTVGLKLAENLVYCFELAGTNRTTVGLKPSKSRVRMSSC